MAGEHIIVGGGIAGCSLAWRMSEAGENVLLVDAGDSASLIAGGVINPLTGRKFALKSDTAERFQALEEFYASLKPYEPSPLRREALLFRTLGNSGESLEALAERRKTEPELDALIVDLLETPPAPEFIADAGILTKAGLIDVPLTLETIKKELTKRGQYQNRYLDMNSLELTEKNVQLEDLTANTITLAQGWEASRTGTFSWLPFVPAKGERLLVEFERPLTRPDILFKRYEVLAPISETKAFFGATFTWDELDTKATEEKRQYLEDRLKSMISLPFKVIRHDAHIRPASRDRKPFLGAHPEHKNLFIFNGLGSLGLSLSPLYSRCLMAHILDGAELPAEADIKRFDRFWRERELSF